MPGKGQRVANYFAAGTAPPEMKRDPTAYTRAAPEVSVPNLHSQENKMKFHAMASAVVLFLVSTAAFAQDSKTTQGAYDGMTDASGAQMVKLFGADMPKLGVLNINNMHDMEHYGNLVTYMRLKNIVPPTSEQAPAAQPKK
jgi:hypothetical protein